MFDLDAPILPGEAAAGIPLGTDEVVVRQRLPPDAATEPLRSGGLILRTPVVAVWIQDGRVTQVGVCRGYRGQLPNGLGIGHSIAVFEARFADTLVEDGEDNLILASVPGLCIAPDGYTLSGDLAELRPMPVGEIYVFSASA